MSELEYTEARERTLNLQTGESAIAVRIKYRRAPARRWSTFLLFVDDPAQAVPDELIEAAIAEHERGPR